MQQESKKKTLDTFICMYIYMLYMLLWFVHYWPYLKAFIYLFLFFKTDLSVLIQNQGKLGHCSLTEHNGQLLMYIYTYRFFTYLILENN